MRLQTFAQAGSVLESAAQGSSAQLVQGIIEHCQYSYGIENDKMMEHTVAALVGLSLNQTVLYGESQSRKLCYFLRSLTNNWSTECRRRFILRLVGL